MTETDEDLTEVRHEEEVTHQEVIYLPEKIPKHERYPPMIPGSVTRAYLYCCQNCGDTDRVYFVNTPVSKRDSAETMRKRGWVRKSTNGKRGWACANCIIEGKEQKERNRKHIESQKARELTNATI